MRCILDTKIATEALVYSYLLYQFLYIPKMSLADADLFALNVARVGDGQARPLHVTFWRIHMALHTYVAVCPCLFSSTQTWMFSWGWQHSCIVLVFLFDDTLWSLFLKFALNAILCKLRGRYWKQYYVMGTVHIIICNPTGGGGGRGGERCTSLLLMN